MPERPTPSAELMELLNAALARELHVCIQYMLQHAVGTGTVPSASGRTPAARRSKFVASHSPYWLPGSSLKRVAITEMRHAEAIAERITGLGGVPTTRPGDIELGATVEEMLKLDREQERKAVELYRRIIDLAGEQGDRQTVDLFRRILADEEKHLRTFSGLQAGT